MECHHERGGEDTHNRRIGRSSRDLRAWLAEQPRSSVDLAYANTPERLSVEHDSASTCVDRRVDQQPWTTEETKIKVDRPEDGGAFGT